MKRCCRSEDVHDGRRKVEEQRRDAARVRNKLIALEQGVKEGSRIGKVGGKRVHRRDGASVRGVGGAELLIPRTVARAIGLAVAVGADVGDGRVIQVGPEEADESIGERGSDDRVLQWRRRVTISWCERASDNSLRRGGYSRAAKC